MKKVLLVLLQTVLFLAAFLLASFLRPFHVVSTLARTATSDRSFVWDGVLLMLALYLVVLAVSAFTGKLRQAAPLTSAALVLAAILGFAMKLGFVTHEM